MSRIMMPLIDPLATFPGRFESAARTGQSMTPSVALDHAQSLYLGYLSKAERAKNISRVLEAQGWLMQAYQERMSALSYRRHAAKALRRCVLLRAEAVADSQAQPRS